VNRTKSKTKKSTSRIYLINKLHLDDNINNQSYNLNSHAKENLASNNSIPSKKEVIIKKKDINSNQLSSQLNENSVDESENLNEQIMQRNIISRANYEFDIGHKFNFEDERGENNDDESFHNDLKKINPKSSSLGGVYTPLNNQNDNVQDLNGIELEKQ